MQESLIENLKDACPVLESFLGEDKPVCAIILGSGLNSFAERLDEPKYLPFIDIPHMKTSTATGHVGRFVLGALPGKDFKVLCMQGRLHGYEGNSACEVAFPVWLMNACGIHTLVTTNAAGAINPNYRVGQFCVMKDQINLTGRNPLVGIEPNTIADRFVPMLDCFDVQLRSTLLELAQSMGVSVCEGVYLGLLGPSFETPAEIRAFGILGADTVAMSVVEEVIAAWHVGMRVLGMSLISNMACGVEGGDPQSDDIMQAAADAEADFARLMDALIEYLANDIH